MKTKDIIEGLTILEKYRSAPDGWNTYAEHDQISAYPTDNPVSEDDLNRLVELGWFQEAQSDDDGRFDASMYSRIDSWSCHT